jgi:FG-GAP repeat
LYSLALADMNGDGKVDAVVGVGSAAEVVVQFEILYNMSP